jgi:hypothetical protein
MSKRKDGQVRGKYTLEFKLEAAFTRTMHARCCMPGLTASPS